MLFRAIQQCLSGAAEPALCVFLDDLQWVDEGTLEWIDFALREADAPILWMGAFQQARSRAQEGIDLIAAGHPLAFNCHIDLCKTWLHDRAEDGLR